MKALNDFLTAFFGLGLGSIFILGLKNVFHVIYKIVNKKYTKDKEELENMKKQLSTFEVAMKALAHDKIYKLTDDYIERGWVTLDELDNLEYLYTAYRGLGGNGTGEKRYNRVQRLPIRNQPSEFVQSRDDVDNYDYVKGGEHHELERQSKQ